jgi:PAS domain S-box-containing protein
MGDSAYRILLVEDDKLDQMAFERLIRDEKLSYDYMIAGSVSQAQSMLDSNSFDVVIVDYRLGDGTAFDIFKLVKGTPIIITTGIGDEETAVKAMKAGVYDYLIKDQEHNYLKVLPEIIKNVIDYKQTEDELKKYHYNLETLVRQRTEQLAEEKELLSVTLSSMGDGLVAVDAKKQIMLFNTVAEKLTGWKFVEVQEKPVGEIFRVINEQTKKVIEVPIDKVLGSGKIEAWADGKALIARDGSKCPISATAAPIRKNDGTIVGVVMVFRDMSREREIDRMKADFISLVSHELRTPLTSIKAYTETILCGPNMPEQTRRRFLAVIDEESNRLANLIEGILELSRIESDAVEIVRKPVSIAVVARQVLSALQPLADKKHIRLKTDICEELPKLNSDKDKIRSVVTNLVSNAIKFTPEGGRVSICIQCRAEELIMSVSDTGIGIPKKELPKIFARFYRVYRPGTQIQGTGLGLAIVKKIVMMHDGRIEVESEVNKGTTFTVFLPLEDKCFHQKPTEQGKHVETAEAML